MYREHNANETFPYTLESHFELLSRQSEEAKKLQSIWILLKSDLEESLHRTQSVFVTFSLHDSSHSRSILRNIERFLGADRIEQLSITDTFMLLVCAYAHDLGMALTIEDVYKLLSSGELRDFILNKNNKQDTLEPEDAKAIRILADYIKCESCKDSDQQICLQKNKKNRMEAIYFAIVVVIQMYIRPKHWEGVEIIEPKYKDLLVPRLNIRFVRNIISICQAHGKKIDVLKELEPEDDGFANDVFHPRFIAAMLRLGDLLDVDNGRFPKWFFEVEEQSSNLIPKLSELHFKKHESISHLRITPEYIAITSSCRSNDFYDEDAYAVAEIASEWFSWIRQDCEYFSQNWSMIAGGQFGAPPGELRLKVLVDGRPYSSVHQHLQLQMSQDRVMKLLEGTNIYRNRYVCIRELLQNAVDASLLQLWYDITHNAYENIGLGKEIWERYLSTNNENLHLPIWVIPDKVYENYKIIVEVVWDKDRNQVRLVVKDRGIGVTPEDVNYMAKIGSSKEENPRIEKILRTMPDWLKPSGVFGIGLQSAFQLTNKLQFYSRRPNEPERHIIFHSYGRNQGKIEIRELRDDAEDPFYNNALQGTNVLIELDINKIFPNGELDAQKNFLNLDLMFSPKDPVEAAYIIMSNIVKQELKAVKCDYFKVSFQNVVVKNKVAVRKSHMVPCRSSFFGRLNYSKLSLYRLMRNKKLYDFSNMTALYWEEDTSRFFRFNVQPCEIKNNQVQFPRPRTDLYRILYKFNEISHIEYLYGKNPSDDHLLNMERNGLIIWDILIMDNSPDKYLNIDRDRLKEGALKEEQLLEIKRHIMEKWCHFFVDEERKKPGATRGNRFKDQQNILVSLMLLFYRYAPADLFKEFASYFEHELDGLCIKGYEYEVKKLWNETSRFRTIYRLSPQKYTKTSGTYPMGPATVELLSHRLFHITQIYGAHSKDRKSISKMQYVSRLGGEITDIEPIEMNEDASLFDYMMSFDPNTEFPTNIRLDSIIKKLFKPNIKFQDIITRNHPTSFCYGRNFYWRMDSCIRSFILSPFDNVSVKILRDHLPTADSSPSTDIREEFITDVLKYFQKKEGSDGYSRQLYYCARYILNERKEYKIISSEADEIAEMNKIIDAYIEFIKHFCNTIFDNSDLVLNQFYSNYSDFN